MIYTLVRSIMVPGRMPEYSEVALNELVPLFPKIGMTFVASFRAYTGNMNEIFTMNSLKDMGDYQKAMEAQKTNKEWLRVNAKANQYRVSQSMTILEPNPWSPMK
jgi:hypothetical protein